MARYIQRPENALKRAYEFIEVGKEARALDTLQEVFRNKKYSYTWSESIMEPIMTKYLELCVELKKSHIAKEGLFQYRNMFQLVNVGSLEKVIRYYLTLAEERCEAARKKSSQAVLDIDDLDNLATPESILLMSAVCGEDAQDRSDRTILLPWVKFLWESYCQCLELLRVNTHCEILYHDIARKAFQFCLNYNRKMEFRKLSEKLRKHLDDIAKPTAPSTQVSIQKPETQQLNLDTRLYQLDSAIQMELWQEAYKAIEDIHGLMVLSKKTPQPKTMANYYQKLAMVFWKAENRLFHAAALLRLLQLSRELKKTITPEELQRMASHVLIATLSIPLPSAHPEYDRFIETDKSPLEKAQRLAVLLNLTQPPTRASLLREIIRTNVFQLALPEFQNLYKWLENEYNPLTLCSNVQNVIDFIKAEKSQFFVQYVDALQDVTLVRLVRQVSQVYQTIEFMRFIELAKFATKFKLERILVDCVRHNDMQITIDHKQSMVLFGTDLSEAQRQDHSDGPMLQSMPSEQVRQQLVNMSVVLHRSIAAINPNRNRGERDALRAAMVAVYHENKAKEHKAILIRQQLIEDRKEAIERQNNEREEEELRKQEELQKQQKIADQKRLEQEAEERERKRQENEVKLIKSRTMEEQKIKYSQSSHGQKLLKIIEEKGTSADPEEIAREEHNALVRERKELQSRLKSQEKKIDYFERAKRIEEVPLIKEYLKEMAVKEEFFWENQEKTRIENAIAERKNAVQQQERLKRMFADRDAYMNQLKAERKNHHQEKLARFNEMLEVERKKRMAQRVVERRKERRDKWLAEKEAEKQRKLEEIRRIEDEKRAAELEIRRKEKEAEMAKLAQIAAIQAKRDAELEEKQRLKREQNMEKERDQRRDDRSAPPQDNVWRKSDTSAAPAAASAAGGPQKEQSAWRSNTVEKGEAKETQNQQWRRDIHSNRDGEQRGERMERGGDRNESRGGDRDRDGGGYRRDNRDRDNKDWRTTNESQKDSGPWRQQNTSRDNNDTSGGGGGGGNSWRTVGGQGNERTERSERGGDRNERGGDRDGGFRRDNRDRKEGGTGGGFRRNDDRRDNNRRDDRKPQQQDKPKQDDGGSWRRGDTN